MFVFIDHLYGIHICIYIYIPAYLYYIYLYEGFVALPSQSLFMLVEVTFVPKICHLVSFSFLFFPVRWEQTEPLLFKPIVQRSRETQRGNRRIRSDWAFRKKTKQLTANRFYSTDTRIHCSLKTGVSWWKTHTNTYTLTQVSHKFTLPLQVFTVCHNHKKASGLWTNCASPSLLITSFNHHSPFVVFIPVAWIKS